MQRTPRLRLGHRLAAATVIGLFAASALGAPVSVDLASGDFHVNAALAGHKDKHKGKPPGQAAKSYFKVTGNGPPPWAPAYGYRRKHGSGGYELPFDIDLGRCNRQLLGSLLGGATGALAGSHIGQGSGQDAAIVGGTIIGVLVGGSIGRSMDQLDQSCIGQILEHGPSDKTVQWQNPDTGAAYEVTPAGTYQEPQGRYCREYQTTATVGGKTERMYGTACRQADGSWQLVS